MSGSSRWVCLDVGETLIEETRTWSVWAEVLGVPPMTLMAAFGAVVERGRDHADVFDLLDVPDWRAVLSERRARAAAQGQIATATASWDRAVQRLVRRAKEVRR